MKKITTILILLAASVTVYAQTLQVGPKIGLNLAKVNDGEETPQGVDEPFLVGFNFGVATNYQLTDMFSIAPELIYTQKGQKQTTENFAGESTAKTRLNYVELPVLIRASFGDDIKGYANLGPTFGFWAGGKYKGKIENRSGKISFERKIVFIDEDESFDDDKEFPVLKDESSRFELGAAFGGGAMMQVGSGNLALDVRYTLGLTNFLEPDDNADKYKNGVLSFSVIYLFGLK